VSAPYLGFACDRGLLVEALARALRTFVKVLLQLTLNVFYFLCQAHPAVVPAEAAAVGCRVCLFVCLFVCWCRFVITNDDDDDGEDDSDDDSFEG